MDLGTGLIKWIVCQFFKIRFFAVLSSKVSNNTIRQRLICGDGYYCTVTMHDRNRWEAACIVERIPPSAHKVVKRPVHHKGLKVYRALFQTLEQLLEFFGPHRLYAEIDAMTFAVV